MPSSPTPPSPSVGPRIAFIAAFTSPFIRRDIDILSRHYRVTPLIGSGLLQVARICVAVMRSDAVYCWFASTYAFVAVAVARMLGKPSIVVVGGVDVARDEQLGYGIWLNPWKRPLVGAALRWADRVLPVDESLRQEIIARVGDGGKNIETVATGYDPEFWIPEGRKSPTVLTVAGARNPMTVRVKGIDVLIEAARELPETAFTVVGTGNDVVRSFSPPANMKFIPWVEEPELLGLYRRNAVYCQPSRREGLPNALCEAMLCGCFPVATAVFGNVTAVGDAGTLVPPEDSRALAGALRDALARPQGDGEKARARVARLFPESRREATLVSLMTRLTA